MIKQVIVLRKDLGMRKGKMCAQACHASMKVFFDRMVREERRKKTIYCFYACKDSEEWIEGSFTKVVVSVDSEEELLAVFEKAQEARLPCSLITDAGRTEFHGEPTKTACAIGPADENKIDKITGGLKLL